MIKGYVVLIEKLKDGTRLIDVAITVGIQGYRRHYPKTKLEDMEGLVNPRMYEECGLAGKTGDGLRIYPDLDIPYRELWVCAKEHRSV